MFLHVCNVVRHMKSTGIQLIHDICSRDNTCHSSYNPHDIRIGFHVPPFTSVDHLHLHVQLLPYRNWRIAWKYKPWCCWYEPVEQSIQKLYVSPTLQQSAHIHTQDIHAITSAGVIDRDKPCLKYSYQFNQCHDDIGMIIQPSSTGHDHAHAMNETLHHQMPNPTSGSGHIDQNTTLFHF